MKKTTTLIALLLFVQISFAQQSEFSKVYYEINNSFSANAMAKSLDGGLIVCGDYSYIPAVMKIDSLGVVQWTNQIGNSSDDAIYSIISTTDSAFIMAGKVFDPGSGTIDLQIIKMNQSGTLLWSKTIYQAENQCAMSIQQTFDNGFIVTGYESRGIPPYSRIIGLKLTATGDVEWYNLYESGNYTNSGFSVKQTPDSGYAIIGYAENSPSYEQNGVLLKLSQTGSFEWANEYAMSIPIQNQGNDLAIAPDGIYSYFSTQNDYVLVKTDFNGVDNWKESISGYSNVTVCANCVSPKMKLLPDGNLIFATGSKSFAQEAAVINIDSAGNFNWAQNLFNSVHDLEQAKDHGFFFLGNGPILGVRATSVLNPQISVEKTDSLGNDSLCTQPLSAISINFGNIIQNSLTMSTTIQIENSVMIIPVVSSISIFEQVGCVDFTGNVEDESVNLIKLFPNPSSSILNVQLPGISGNIDLQIIDILGQVIFSRKYNLSSSNEIQIDQKFKSGMYSVVVSSNDRKIVEKFIVQ